MNVVGYVKEHPWMVGGITLAVIAVAILFFGGSGGDESNGPMTVALPGAGGASDASIQAGMQIQALGIQSKAHETEVLATKEISLATIAADLKKKEYEMQTSFHVADIAGRSHALDVASSNYKSLLDFKLGAQKDTHAYQLGTQAYKLDTLKATQSYNLGVKTVEAQRVTALTGLKNALTLGLARIAGDVKIATGDQSLERYRIDKAFTLGLGQQKLDLKQMNLDFTSNANFLEQQRTLEKLRLGVS